MNHYFRFKQFQVNQDRCAMKVSTDSCLFGAWVAAHLPEVCNKVLDLGAGTGLLSLMVAQACNASVDAVEIEEACYGQLQENIGLSPWSSRIRALHTDARTLGGRSYDLSVSNPPFHERQLASPVAGANAARHSSHLGLHELLEAMDALMCADGHAAVLLPFYRKEELARAASAKGMHPLLMAVVRHSPSHPWYRIMVLLSRREMEVQEECINVRAGDGNYSVEFMQLLQPYYLFL